MRFEEAVVNLQKAIMQEANIPNAVLEIRLSHRAYDWFIVNLCRERPHYNMTPSNMANMIYMGVRIKPTREEE